MAPFMAIIRRELIVGLRRSRAFYCLVAVVSQAVIGVLWVWPSDATLVRDAGGTSRQILSGVALVLMAGCALFVPGLAASTFTSEKDQDTFDMLRMTLARPVAIIAAKFASALGFYLLLMLAVFPALAATFFLVGLDWADVAFTMLAVLVLVVTCAAIGVWASLYFRRPVAALGASYFAMLAVTFGPGELVRLFAFLFNRRQLGLSGRSLFAKIHFGATGQAPWAELAKSALIPMGLTAICLFFALRLFNRPPKVSKETFEKPIDDAAVLERRRREFPYYLLDPLRRKKPIEDGRNPMLVREFRWGLFGKETRFIRAFYLSFVFFAITGVVATIMVDGAAAWMWMVIAVILMLIPAFVGNTFAKEYELGNVDMLRMTVLRPGEIVEGKMLAGAMSIGPLFGAVLLAVLPTTITILVREASVLPVLTGFVSLCVCAFLMISLSLSISSSTRRTAIAVIGSYLAGAVLFGLPWFGWWIMAALGGPGGVRVAHAEHIGVALTLLSPPVALFQVRSIGQEAFLHWLTWLGSLTIFTLMALGFWGLCVRRVARMGTRE